MITGVVAAIGIISAGIGYITSGTQFYLEISDYLHGRSETRALIAAANDRLAFSDYEAAWRANSKARQLSPRNAEAARQQAHIAMNWLENVRLSSEAGPKTFSEVADPLKTALIERLAEAHGREKADIHAHIGWANFLRYRDGISGSRIAEEFDAAINEDPDNMYGHVMRAFWMLWNGGPIDDARADLETALRSDVDPAYTDEMVLAALTNITTDEFMVASIEFASKIRKAGRNIEDHYKGLFLWYYSLALRDKGLLEKISNAIPPSERVATLEWLRQANINEYEKRTATYFMAYYLEIDGKTDNALRLYNDLVSSSPDKNEDLTRLARVHIGRIRSK